jgi:phosphate-selective porin OprO and OprP
MKSCFRLTALAVAAALFAAPALAQKVETKGGIKVSSDDGNYEFAIGGRIHFDAYAFDRDLADVTGTSEFRRARLTLAGKAHGWEYKLEQDFSAGSTTEGFRDVFIARRAFGGKVTIGQFKPYRSMDEMTSSNEVTMMERPFSSASGLYGGRQFQQGVGYQNGGSNYSAGVSVFNLRHAASVRNEGVGAAGRVTYAPINTGDRTLHLGASLSHENTNKNSGNLSTSVAYAGRRGPSQSIASTAGASGEAVNTLGLELAGAFGPAFLQSEFARARFGQPLGSAQEVDTWYLMGSWLIGADRRPYKAGNGVFGTPKASGAWELTARYDSIENKDLARKVNSAIVGVTYYANPHLRFMLNLTRGDNEVTGDKTGQIALRTQFHF